MTARFRASSTGDPKPWPVVGLVLTWVGVKGLSLAGGIKNICDEK